MLGKKADDVRLTKPLVFAMFSLTMWFQGEDLSYVLTFLKCSTVFHTVWTMFYHLIMYSKDCTFIMSLTSHAGKKGRRGYRL